VVEAEDLVQTPHCGDYFSGTKKSNQVMENGRVDFEERLTYKNQATQQNPTKKE
jgi:hypothetical protein